MAEIRGAIIVERRGDRDHRRTAWGPRSGNVGRLELGRCSHQTALNDAPHERVQIDLLDMHAP
jgi:hypothetical protein